MSLPVNKLTSSNREKLHQNETISSFGHAQPTCRTVIKHIYNMRSNSLLHLKLLIET